MRIKKKIFAMLMMLCMVLQMLPNTVLAETISGEGNTYIGPTRICPNSNLEFYFTTDNVGPDGRDAWIGRIDKIDETYLSVCSKGDTWFAVISKNGIQKAYSQSSSFSICIFSNTVSTLRQLNITINISHIDDNFDHKCDDCGEKISDHIDNDRDHYCDTCKVRVSCSGGTATCKGKAICEICDQPYGEVDPTNHVGGTEIRDSKAATCTEDGYEGDIYCKDCGVKLSSGEPIVAFGHTYKDEVTKEATTESAGIRTYTCEKCGDSYTEEIAKLPAKPEPTKPSKPENRVEPTKPSEPQKQIEPPKTVNQISLIEILIAMFVNGIAVPSMQLITSIWQLILQFIKMLLTAAF